MFNIVFCLDLSLKDLVYFLYDVGRLLFWTSFEICIIEDIFGFIGEIFLENNFRSEERRVGKECVP